MGSPVTVSIGIACSRSHASHEATFKAADEALYQAKKAGRDRIVLAAPIEQQISG
ncbi:diguanylate cyclase [Stutzerimonas stutzeri]|uniref:diguanylate cyclase n=1 Tax=Stutzerimonas stutzeri TaxID=316 RepID=UPI00301317B4